jgi:hypothetical protein
MATENEDRYRELIEDLESHLQWTRMEELLGDEFEALEHALVAIFVQLVRAENKAKDWRHIASRCVESIGHTDCCADCTENGQFAIALYKKAIADGN